MNAFTGLPWVMVAPNGARRSKADHPELPITIDEIVTAAVECAEQGATGIHLHVRDTTGAHVLDAGLYREALAELKSALPDMQRQITTEAVGRYSPQQQRQLVMDVAPEAVSVSIAEMLSDDEPQAAVDFYRWCESEGIAVQHIVYGPSDLVLLESLFEARSLDVYLPQLLYVLGRNSRGQQSAPQDLAPFTRWLATCGRDIDWAVCAFGKGETDCLVAAYEQGGKLRVGFENSLWNSDGSLARNNAERVREVIGAIAATDARKSDLVRR